MIGILGCAARSRASHCNCADPAAATEAEVELRKYLLAVSQTEQAVREAQVRQSERVHSWQRLEVELRKYLLAVSQTEHAVNEAQVRQLERGQD